MKHNPKVAERELTEDIIAFERENNEISQICQQCWSFLNYFSSFHPSTICLPFILVKVTGGLEAIPATIGQEAGCILEIRQSVTGLTHRVRQWFTLTLTPLTACRWIVRGSRSTWGEHANSTRKPSCYKALLIPAPPHCPLSSLLFVSVCNLITLWRHVNK